MSTDELPVHYISYDLIYHDVRSMVMTLTGVDAAILDERATELGLHYDHFLGDYSGGFLVDAHIGFARMMESWPRPWPAVVGSTLNGLSLADFLLAWAWEENDTAKRAANELNDPYGPPNGSHQSVLIAAVSAAKSLEHGKRLLPSESENWLAQAALVRR